MEAVLCLLDAVLSLDMLLLLDALFLLDALLKMLTHLPRR